MPASGTSESLKNKSFGVFVAVPIMVALSISELLSKAFE